MVYSIKIRTLLWVEKRKWVFLVGLVALTHLFCQSLMLPYGNALLSLLPPNEKNRGLLKASESSDEKSYNKASFGDHFDTDGVLSLEKKSVLVRRVKNAQIFSVGRDVDDDKESIENDKEGKINSELDDDAMDNDSEFIEDETLDNVNVDSDEELMLQTDVSEKRGYVSRIGEGELSQNASLIEFAKGSADDANKMLNGKTIANGSVILLPSGVSLAKPLVIESVVHKKSESEASTSDGSNNVASLDQIKETSSGGGHHMLRSQFTYSNNTSSSNRPVRKKMRCDMPPKTVTPVDEMQKLLVRHRARSRAMRPRWSSDRDQEILSAKLKIENPPILKNDQELYAPLFRNISMFKRSYELMERMLKIYVYKDGERPIFHRPILKGLYASEGWFMKLMEGNKRFSVKDPRKAHLFYMPFSSRMLEYTLYVHNSHNRTNLRQYLKEYTEKIAAKYRFWNRTGGADHFLVACHDWAPYETRHHMEHSIKALCNADVTLGFKIGRDVSLPETYVRSARNPLRDMGGKPPSQRHILAFYAGNMHGYLRTILLEHWKDRDEDMKILGPMAPGVASKMKYINHMKSSRYCICPKGYEVNSPRIVEAIFYECVPVIISDNFVPPFFEVLNWDAFSLIIAEKEIPSLRKILESIPEEKYVEMQVGVRKAQRHFLWHVKPIKYDLFHMTLHSIWYNRVFQIKPR